MKVIINSSTKMNKQWRKYMSQLDEFRLQKDLFFESDHQSPLTLEQRGDFEGLNYFPENKELIFKLEIRRIV